MKLTLYYIAHTFKNNLKKIFKSWIILFMLFCMLIGGGIGFLAAEAGDALVPEADSAQIVEPVQEETDFPDGEADTEVTEIIVGGIILLILALEIARSDKSGGAVFLPADVVLLFSAPLAPQSVLMFRLITQLGIQVIASIYLVFQIPNLMMAFNGQVLPVVMAFVAWILTAFYTKLIQMILYLIASKRPAVRKWIRPVLIGVLLAVAAAFLIYWKSSGQGLGDSVFSFFNAPASRWVPVWGWLKGIIFYTYENNYLYLAIQSGILILGILVLIILIWRTKADFYEDAMNRSEELAALKREASESSLGMAKKKKVRKESLRKNEFSRGWGASVFFFKEMYNRFRFSWLKGFTTTGLVYSVVLIGAAVILRFAFEVVVFLPVALLLAGMVFFRSLGNPLAKDIRMEYFRLIPEKTPKKLFWSLAAGTVGSLMDWFPGYLIAGILLKENPLHWAAWMLFILSMDVYSTTVGTFIDVSVPEHIGKMLKQMVQVLFIYFGLVPDAVLIVLGFMNGQEFGFIMLSTLLNLGLGLIFFALIPLFLDPRSGTPSVRSVQSGQSMFGGDSGES